VITCDARATCDRTGDEPKCVCPDGDDDPSGFGTRCVPPIVGCADDCGDGFCIDGVCCETACDAPPACQTAEGATCADGKTCVYTNLDDGTACDDADACTENDACTAGACAGTALDCDDGNICTADSCDQTDGCVNDGTDITTVGCADDTLCAGGYACAGNKRGDCNPATFVNCGAMTIGCNVGTCDEGTGACVAVQLDDGAACSDGNACTVDDSCHSGACSAGTAVVCNDGNPCTDDSCDPGSGCVGTIDMTNTCTDNNGCTLTDHCDATGTCVGTAKVCPPSDGCHNGVCNDADGSCGQVNKDDGTTCNDNKNCTKNETCSSGTCVDGDVDSACLEGSMSCTEVSTRTCTCASGYVFDTTARTCVRDLCSPGQNPCSPNANCTVASGASVATCTCKAGFDGNGTTCTDHDDCVGNPCGAGNGCTDSPAPGTHTCQCTGGLIDVKGKCVCDLNGVWALKITTMAHWSGIDGIKNGSTTSIGWAIRSQNYDANGNLTVTAIQCGGTSPTLCGNGANAPLVPAEAYAQFNASQMYGSVATPGVRTDVAPAYPQLTPLPNMPFIEPESAALSGIHLTDPLNSDWPTSRSQVGAAAGSAINGAYWVDDDHDGKLGTTSFVTPPGGTPVSLFSVNGTAFTPMAQETFTDPTDACNPALHFNYVPAQCGITVCRVKATFGASRVISRLQGNMGATCDSISGDVAGILNDGRIGGCILANGSTQRECSYTDNNENYSSLLNGLDAPGAANPVVVDSSHFSMKKIANPSALTCADVRAMTF
jgi:hypothetical protein